MLVYNIFFKKKDFYLFIFCNLLKRWLSHQQKSFRRNWMLEPPLVLTGCSSIHFFNSLLSRTQSIRPPLVPYHSLCSTCVTPCRSIGLKVFLPNPYLGKKRISQGVASIQGRASAHISRLLATKRYYLVGSIYVLDLLPNIISTSHWFSTHF